MCYEKALEYVEKLSRLSEKLFPFEIEDRVFRKYHRALLRGGWGVLTKSISGRPGHLCIKYRIVPRNSDEYRSV